MGKKNKIPKIEPPRELCKNCREWIDGKDLNFNDIPHCICERNFEAYQYIIGFANNCKCFNEW